MKRVRRFLGLIAGSLDEKVCNPAMNVSCGEFEVNKWIVSEFIIDRLIGIVGTHPFPIDELCLLVSAVCRLKPTHIFEWGTHIGKSARIFYETSRHFGLNSEIHSIDLPDEMDHEEHPRTQRGNLVKGLRGVKLYQGDGLSKAIELCRMINPAKPLFFIDGDHDYETVRRELSTIIAEIPHANILLHDTFYQSAESGYNVGPYKAITETLVAMPDRYRVISANIGLPGMTLLYQV